VNARVSVVTEQQLLVNKRDAWKRPALSVNRSKSPVLLLASSLQFLLYLFDVHGIARSECEIVG
jgi:hypothetical protein